MDNGNRQGSFGGRPIQLQLWDRPALDPKGRLKTAMREALDGSGLSREKVVADMNAVAEAEGLTCNGNAQKITTAMLDKWVAAGSPAYMIPAAYLPLFCLVTRSLLPLNALAAPLQAEVIEAEDRRLLEWARVETTRRKLNRDARKLAQEVGIP